MTCFILGCVSNVDLIHLKAALHQQGVKLLSSEFSNRINYLIICSSLALIHNHTLKKGFNIMINSYF